LHNRIKVYVGSALYMDNASAVVFQLQALIFKDL